MWPDMVYAQTDTDIDDMLQELMERDADSDAADDVTEGQERWAEMAETLHALHENPLQLNTATKEELLALPFLNHSQVEAIRTHQALWGRIRSWKELRAISGLSLDAIRWLPLVTTLDTDSLPYHTASGKRREWKHNIMTRLDIPLYEREGWPWARGIANRLRYNGTYGRKAEWGLRASKDAGEQMFTRTTPLWDAYGGYVVWHGMMHVRTLIVGDFKAGFGEGLVLNNGLMIGKSALGWQRTTTGIRPHRSTSEYSYLRGVAGEVELLPSLALTALYSYRQLDATLWTDGTVRSLSEAGLHRTATEIAKRHNTAAHTTAMHLQWRKDAYQMGLTAMYQHYNRSFGRGKSLYTQIAPLGNRFANVAVDYGYRLSPLLVSGETAHSLQSGNAGWATLNRVSYQVGTSLELSALQRYYSRYYHSALASAYSENTSVQNESGLAVQADAQVTPAVSLLAMADFFYSPWARYSMSRSSRGWETTIQTKINHARGRSTTVRYAVKSKEMSDQRYYSHRFRATYKCQVGNHLALVPSALLHIYSQPSSASQTGFAIVPRADYTAMQNRLRLSLLAAWFKTDGWQSRLHMYEPSLYQVLGMQQYYGCGQRVAATVRYQAPDGRWHLQAKVGFTNFTDRDVQSSGVSRVNSPRKTDVQLLFRLKL